MIFSAEEDRDRITRAVRVWFDKFTQGGEPFRFRSMEGRWHPELGVWGAFNDPSGLHRLPGYWNPFGRALRSNPVVEINPSREGIHLSVQGVIAVHKGERWILHQGRLHPPGLRITEEMFDRVAIRDRVKVTFSNGNDAEYHLVGNIDADPGLLKTQIASFVSQCENVRLHYLTEGSQTSGLSNVAAIEGLFPEIPGSYVVGPQGPKTILKTHPDVWLKLKDFFVSEGVVCSNGRVMRWGPDLLTCSNRPILFEIKSDETASELQRAVGQLLLYEKLLRSPHLKVLVYPQSEKSTSELRDALKRLKIHVLPYWRSGRSLQFESNMLGRLLKHTKGVGPPFSDQP